MTCDNSRFRPRFIISRTLSRELPKLERALKACSRNDADLRERLSTPSARHYRAAFGLMLDRFSTCNPFTEKTLCAVNRSLLGGGQGDEFTSGRYRKAQSYVLDTTTRKVIYVPPPASDVPGLMKALLSWLRHDHATSAVLTAGITLFQIFHIHPFAEGNGRTARFVATLHLYQRGFDFKNLFTLDECFDHDRSGFYEVLQYVRNNRMDMTPWLEYLVRSLAYQIRITGCARTLGERLG